MDDVQANLPRVVTNDTQLTSAIPDRLDVVRSVGVAVVGLDGGEICSAGLHHGGQLHRVDPYAAMGWKIVRRLDSASLDGSLISRHRANDSLRADVAAGRVHLVLSARLSDLGRSAEQVFRICEMLATSGANLLSLDEGLDTGRDSWNPVLSVLRTLSHLERNGAARQSILEGRAKAGKSLGGAPPFGFRKDGDRLVLSQSEAPVRRLIFQLFLEHKRLKTVARLLNGAGYRTRRGHKFTDTTVRRLIEDPAAKGERRTNYTHSGGPGSAWSLKPRDEWIVTPVDPIVSAETWQEANDLLARNHTGGNRRT